MEKRSHGEGSLLWRKGCKFWYGQYYKDGRAIRFSTKESVKAKAWVALRREMGKNDLGLGAPITELKKITYGAMRTALITNYLERGNKSLETRADGSETIVGLKQLDEYFGFSATSTGVPATRLTTDAARAFTKKRLKEGAGPAMVNRSLACLRRMLRIAHEDGKIFSVPKIRLLKEPAARKGFLPLEKFKELIAALPSHLRPLITFLYYCGVRLGEAVQIEWQQVDLKQRLVRLEDDQTKNGEARVVPLPSVLVEMLEEIEPKTGLVFNDTNLRTEWSRACAAVGLGTIQIVKSDRNTWHRYTGLIVHDLRRSAIRNLVNAGVPEKVAMRISGHKTRAVFDRYHIVSTDDVTNAMRSLESAAVQTEAQVSAKLVQNSSLTQRKPALGA
jgi:integrase